ncbi:MAG TPA: acyltransferase domain-containing protein [Mycobacterium sp.]|nr:acyltransferase domain-containing protein [Mycobacterium sp.]HTX93749.1 acyltransferase domain-containing protein [Mycobacterium sp.]
MLDVAVIGLACRFPAAAGPGDFWRLIRDGREVTRFPGEVADFDADFFNLSPREAAAMDPRQRLALELAWELFEDAFVVPQTLCGSAISVYVGAMSDDYAVLTLRDAADNLDHHSFTGISRAMIANRISYAFGLHGPSMTVDSGQSSSLVAVHLACETLRGGESPLAIAGGVHLNLAEETALLEREFGAVSKSGHTYAFDRRADGYVRGEGAGLVLLKPLPAALEDGDRIHAVIRGSAVGNAGHHGAGQTAPSSISEADVIRRALLPAGLSGADIDYIEAHGTGTKIGDAVEARALGDIFAERRHRPVSVGSVKTNIGHAGAAAGIAGLLKAILAIGHSMIPPTLNYASGPDVDVKTLGLQVNTSLSPWPPVQRPRRAGVSSFGMGGTNAHVIVEQAPALPESVVRRGDSSPAVAWVVSARSADALAGQAQRLLARLRAAPDWHPVDVGWSLASTRAVFEHRAVLVGGDREQLLAGLAGLGSGQPGAAVVGRARSVGKTVFVFPGQGSQWLGMGRQLYERFAVFADAFDEVVSVLDTQLRLPLREVMWGGEAKLLESTEFAQPALFAIEVALVALWRSWGVTPDVVLGHSVGELAAAWVAGVLSLADAARIVALRGRLMAGLPAGGVMVAVGASEAEMAPLLREGVSIAALNGPDAVVVSGSEAAVDVVADGLVRAGRRVRRLAVSHAFHSALMEPMLDDFSAALGDVRAGPPRIDLVSNLTGQLAGPGYGSGRYWVEHARAPVRFVDGVRLAESLGGTVFVEVGPGGAMSAAVEQSLTAEQPMSVVTMGKDRREVDSVLTAAAQLFSCGVNLNWAATFAGLNPQRIELPTYAFARQPFWLKAGSAALPDKAGQSPDVIAQLHGLPPEQQQRRLIELVCEHAAVVLGHSSGHTINRERPFQDLGFDSLTGVELRNRLTTATGSALSRTLIFDYPNPVALADHLRQRLFGDDDEESDEEKIWSSLRRIPLRELRRTGLLDQLLRLAGGSQRAVPETVSADLIDSLSPEALIEMALNSTDDEDRE